MRQGRQTLIQRQARAGHAGDLLVQRYQIFRRELPVGALAAVRTQWTWRFFQRVIAIGEP